MASISAARAFANNEVAFIAWRVEKMIPGCLGFEVTRIYEDKSERVLAAWVPFRGQSNHDWKPQSTSVWPVQKLCWRDLTLRRRRDALDVRKAERVRYRVRPMTRDAHAAAPAADPGYQGTPIPLVAIDDGALTDWVDVTSSFGKVHVAFTNGILSAQWLRHAIEDGGQKFSAGVIREKIATPGDPTRKYLAGDVLGLLEQAIRPHAKAALYELSDEELVSSILKHKDLDIILSNSSKDRGGTKWDSGNGPARKKLHDANVRVTDRMFNNNHIGHNKFVVADGVVTTGSTNWTPTGLCGQSNNAIRIESDDVAKAYTAYWKRLEDDTKEFDTPSPLSAGTSNKQGPELRKANGARAACDVNLDGTRVRVWFSPNTKQTTKRGDLPPDLADVYSRIRKAKDAIFFAVFMPSRNGKLSVIEEAIEIGTKDPTVCVYGAISDPTAMPNYVAPPKKGDDDEDDDEPAGSKKLPLPAIYDNGNVHVVRAAAITEDDVIADFEAELLKVGNAIIHDKIVVIDPLSEDCTVIMGSHNLGYKASYENDENLLVLEGNSQLAQAYAVHVLDVYDHYRFRASQQEARRTGKEPWEGVLETDDLWLKRHLKEASSTASLVEYFTRKD